MIVGNDRIAALRELERRLETADGRVEVALRNQAARIRRDLEVLSEGNEDGSNRDVPPFDNDPRTDEEIKQSVFDAYDRGEWDS